MTAAKCLKMFVCLISILMVTSIEAVENTTDADSVITSDVKGKFAGEPSLTPFVIEVTTNNGIVILTGEVASEENASKAVELAQSAPGANDIDATKLKVKNATKSLEDLYVSAKIKGMFLKDKLFDNKDIPMAIKVETTDGVVHLSGNVKDNAEMANAISIAKKVRGVKSVDSAITVNGASSSTPSTAPSVNQ